MKKYTLLSVVALLLVASMTFGDDGLQQILPENTGPFKHVDRSSRENSRAEIFQHQRNLARRTRPASAAVSQDVGDVAVVVDNGSIIIQPTPANPIDLPLPTNLNFNPAAEGFAVAFAPANFDPAIGAALPLSDDSTAEVSLGGFSFPFLGVSYSSIFVNSDGNITLGAGDAHAERDAFRLVEGPPRIAPLLQDLNVEAGGSINASVRTDRVVVTWMAVPEFGTTNLNTFQVTLHATGQIEFAYNSLGTTFAVIGVAKGNSEGPINEIDYTAALPTTLAAGAIFEEFAPAMPKQVDPVALAQEFYRTHSDKYDFLVLYTDFPYDLGANTFSYAFFIKNETKGINVPTIDDSSDFGSQGELEAFVNLNDVDLYWPDANKLVDPPIDKFRLPGGATVLGPPGESQLSIRARRMGTDSSNGTYNVGLNSAMSVMAQEVGHRWGARVPFLHPTKGVSVDSADLLGRSLVHWSFFFNTTVPASQFGGDPRSSSLEGNSIFDYGGPAFGFCTRPGEGAFLTERNELVDGYSNLDQYLMGMRRAADVGPFWYVDEPRRATTGVSLEGLRSQGAVDDQFFCGKRVNLTINDIINFPGGVITVPGFGTINFPANGPRIPAIGDEDDDGHGNDVKTMAFILLVEQGTPSSHASAIGKVENFRQTWQQYANGPATGGRGKFDTSLNPVIY